MPNYRRWHIEGGVYFFTLVAEGRREIFCTPTSRSLLRVAIEAMQSLRPFEIDAMVLVRDHIHMILRLPPGDSDFSKRLAGIKYRFTKDYLAAGGTESPATDGAKKHRLRGVWQRRFYEHLIRDSEDYRRHVDYVHINPVKHGLVKWPRDWPWSTFHRWARAGEYDSDWCGHVELPGDVYLEPDTW